LLEVHKNSQRVNKNKKDIFLINDPARLGEKIPVKNVCPGCHSVYITKDHCEACGLQLGVDLIGEPFGTRSFFTLKDDFNLNLSKLDHIQWSLAPKVFLGRVEVKRYIRHILKRFNDLSSHLYSLQLAQASGSQSENDLRNIEEKAERIGLFIFEAKEIMKEYTKFSNDLSAFFVLLKKNRLTEGRMNSIGNSLVSYMYELNGDITLSQDIGSSTEGVFSYWAIVKKGIVLEALVTMGAITLASFLVFKFLAV